MTIKYLTKINIPYFIMAFISGYIIAQLTLKPSKTVVRYNNTNRGKMIYETEDDKGSKCYKYVAEEIKCPNSTEILDHPVVLNY